LLKVADFFPSTASESQNSSKRQWFFASPLKHGRLPYSYTGVWFFRSFGLGLAKSSGIWTKFGAKRYGHIGNQALREAADVPGRFGTPWESLKKSPKSADAENATVQ
jgi:hypothetical protein